MTRKQQDKTLKVAIKTFGCTCAHAQVLLAQNLMFSREFWRNGEM